ncbi:MAG: glycosyltransferase family 39 protein [Thermodesulfobacteriota bacterium]|nr:glycosyltransferase family 39 protein [Thermodesulfobacteriota bacterium]
MAVLGTGSDIAPKFIHFMFALATAWLIFTYLRRHFHYPYASLGALFFLSIPIIVQLSITVYVDLGFVFFSTAALLALMTWRRENYACKYFFSSAVSCGLALGTKYNGLIVFLILSCFVPFIYLDNNRRKNVVSQMKGVGYAGLFVVIALLVFSPWMIRNYVWTQNPLYPLYDNVFNPTHGDDAPKGIVKADLAGDADIEEGTSITLAKAASSGRTSFGRRRLLYDENWWEIMTIPLRVFFQGQDGTGEYFDGKLTPFLFFLPFFAFFRKDQTEYLKKEKFFLLAFSLLLLFFVFFTADMRIRYIAPIIPPLVILSISGVHRIGEYVQSKFPLEQRHAGVLLISPLLLLMFAVNASYIVDQFKIVNPSGYLSGHVSKAAYIEHFRPEYPVIMFANKHLPEDAKILTVFLGRRGYYFDRDILFMRPGMLNGVIEESNTGAGIYEFLKVNGITHLFIQQDIFKGWLIEQFSKKDRTMVADFFRDFSHLLYFQNKYGLYELK